MSCFTSVPQPLPLRPSERPPRQRRQRSARPRPPRLRLVPPRRLLQHLVPLRRLRRRLPSEALEHRRHLPRRRSAQQPLRPLRAASAASALLPLRRLPLVLQVLVGSAPPPPQLRHPPAECSVQPLQPRPLAVFSARPPTPLRPQPSARLPHQRLLPVVCLAPSPLAPLPPRHRHQLSVVSLAPPLRRHLLLAPGLAASVQHLQRRRQRRLSEGSSVQPLRPHPRRRSAGSSPPPLRVLRLFRRLVAPLPLPLRRGVCSVASRPRRQRQEEPPPLASSEPRLLLLPPLRPLPRPVDSALAAQHPPPPRPVRPRPLPRRWVG